MKKKIPSYKVNSAIKKIPNIKNIFAIASGKGGVGKSTVTLNLALALQEQGAKVGILDADIYGPSIPGLLGIEHCDKPIKGDKFYPITKFSLATLSIGYLIDSEQAAIWRGPIISNTLMQMLTQTEWPELDFLLIDLPPGTGDIQLTLAKKIPVTAAIIVTTPQNIATKIAAKAIAMFNKLSVPVLGVVENMGPYICKSCGSKEDIFKSNGGDNLAKQYKVPLLGQIPLNHAIMYGSDTGSPIVADKQHIKSKSPVRNSYINLALNCLDVLSGFEQDMSINNTNITIE